MKALILAAGRGSRMEGMTDDSPKCLVELHGRALLDWQLRALNEAGVSQVGIVTGYRREDLEARGLPTFHNPLWSETNMVQSLASAAEWLGCEDCIVSYADIVYGAGAVQALRDAPPHQFPLALTYDPDWLEQWSGRFEDPLSDAESFRLDNQTGRLIEIGARCESVDQIEGQFMGLLRFTPEAWSWVEKLLGSLPSEVSQRLDTTSLLQRLLKQGHPIQAVPTKGLWGEVDRPEDLRWLAERWPAPETLDLAS